MEKIKLGVIFGGMSTEHDVSNVSGTSVISNLDKSKYDIYPIYIAKNGDWFEYIKEIKNIKILKIGEQPQELKSITNKIEELQKLDCIFPVLHGLYGEDGTIQGLFELIKKPYVGCKVLASSVCMDKIYTKIILEKAGIKQAKAIILNKNDDSIIYIDDFLEHITIKEESLEKKVKEKLGYPVFVKPSNSGSSVGVNKANNTDELIKSINEAGKYDTEILIEEAITGKEVECAVLGNEDAKASEVGQILSADEFYNYESKYKKSESKVIIPANLTEDTRKEIKKIAVKAFKAVKGTGLARVDFFANEETGEIYLNEINTMPGFTNISMYPKLWEYTGIKYSDLLDELIRLAMNK